MKIVLIIHHRLDKNAGAPGVVMSLRREFEAVGHTVSVLSHDQIALVPQRLRPIAFPLFCAFVLWFRHRAADVIDASSGTAWLYFRMARHKKRGLYVSHSHGLSQVVHDNLMTDVRAGRRKVSWKYPLFNGSILLWQDAETFRSADLALFLNQPDKMYAVERLGVGVERARTVKNGLSDTFLDAASVVAVRKITTRRRVVQVGTYIDRKGIRTTAAALTPLMRIRTDLELTFLGTCCPEGVTFADYPADLHPRIHVTSSYENEDLPSLLCVEDIFVMPSISEGFGLAPLEAMACGVVPIVTDIAGPTEFIKNRQNGLLVHVGDHDGLSSAVAELLDDDVLYNSLRTEAINTAVRLTWSSVAADRIALYESFRRSLVP